MKIFLEVAFVLFVAVGLLIYSGWGLTVWLTPKRFSNRFYFLLPFLSLTLIDSLTHLTLYANLPGYRAIWILLIVATVINAAAFIYNRSQFRLPNRYETIAYIVAIPALIFVLAPMFTQDELVPLVTGSNADSISHTATTDWLRQHPFSDEIIQDTKYPVNVPIQGKVKTDVRLGFHFYQMYLDILTKQQAYNTFSFVAAIGFYLWSLATGFFAGTVLRLEKTATFLAIFLFSLNSLPLWIAFGGYGPQILGMGLMIMAFAWWVHALQEFNWRHIVLAAAFSAAFAGIYSDVLPYLVAPVGLLFLTLLVQHRKNIKRLRQILGTSLFAGILTLLFNPFGWYRALSRSTNVAANPNLGNIDWWIDLRQVFGLAHFERNLSIANSTLEKMLLSIVLIVLAGFIIYGFVKLHHQLKIIALCFILPHVGTLLWFSNKPHSHYLYFKGWSVGLFIFVILLAMGLYTAFKEIKPHSIYTKFAYVGFVLLCILLVRSSVNQIVHVEKNLAVTPDIIDIGLWADDIPTDERIYLAPMETETSVVSVFWIAYFLIDHPIRYGTRMVYAPYPVTPYQQEPWILREKNSPPFWDGDLWDEKVVKENDTYVLSGLEWKNSSFTVPHIPQPLNASVNDQFHLLGYDFFQEQRTINLALIWQVAQHTEENFKLFIHLIDEDNNLVQQWDTYPNNGLYTTNYWQQGEIIQDTYQLNLSNDLPSGTYALKIGWYLEETGNRLPVEQDGKQVEDSSILVIDSLLVE